MRRRKFITLLGGAATAWPLAASGQQGERVRRVGVLMNVAAADQEGQAQVAAFLQALQQLGWDEGRNVRIDTRWGENDVERDRRYATELLAFAPGRARERTKPAPTMSSVSATMGMVVVAACAARIAASPPHKIASGLALTTSAAMVENRS